MRTINDAAISIFQKKHSYRNTKSDKALCTIAYSLITPFAAVRADEEYALTGRLFSTDRLGAKILALLWTDQVAPPYAANLSAMVDAPEGLIEQALDLFQREGYLRFPCQQGPCFFNKEFLNAVEDDRPFLDVMSERQMSVFELNTLQALVGEDDREDGPIPGTGGDQAGGLASFPPERLLEEVRKDLGGSPRTPFSKAMNRLTKGLTREEESVLYLLLGQFARYFLRPLSCMDLRSGAWALAVRQQVGTLIRKGLVESVVEYDEKGDRARKGLFRISPRCAEVFRGRETVIDYSQLAETGSFLTQDEIQRKELYFPEEDLEAMGRLRKALRPGHYERIVSSLAAKGLRTSISAILAGPPGTGKTELARQVALETGRSLFIVDAAKLYGALWGDSEKNFRKLFQTYRYVCAVTRNAPILFMDEAEGILAGRGSVERSIDRSQNIIQNIILEELNTLPGILIATTNLLENLDDAMARRFMLKLQFHLPDQPTRTRLWKDRFPGLSEEEAGTLATSFEISGGLIDNIAMMATVDSVIEDRPVTLGSLVSYCRSQVDAAPARRRIGFDIR